MKSKSSFTVCQSINYLDTDIKHNFDVLFTSVKKYVKS